MKLRLQLLAAALGLFPGAGPASACMESYRTYFSYSRLQPVGSTVNIRVRVVEIRGDLILAELDERFDRLSDDGKVRILLPAGPGRFGCVQLGPTQGPVFVTGIPVQGPSGTLTFQAVASRPVRFRRVRSLDHYDRYIVDPAYLSPEGRRRREEGREGGPRPGKSIRGVGKA